MKKKVEEVDESFSCAICLMLFENDEKLMPLTMCEHIFHQGCLTEYLKVEISNSKIPISCPDAKCQIEICDDDIK